MESCKYASPWHESSFCSKIAVSEGIQHLVANCPARAANFEAHELFGTKKNWRGCQ